MKAQENVILQLSSNDLVRGFIDRIEDSWITISSPEFYSNEQESWIDFSGADILDINMSHVIWSSSIFTDKTIAKALTEIAKKSRRGRMTSLLRD